MDDSVVDFRHPVLNEAISAIGGEYVLNNERRVADAGADLLYYTGYFMIDRSCCGVGGSAYAMVPGYVVDWQYKIAEDEHLVSRVRPVKKQRDRTRIEAMIRQGDPMCRVTFL